MSYWESIADRGHKVKYTGFTRAFARGCENQQEGADISIRCYYYYYSFIMCVIVHYSIICACIQLFIEFDHCFSIFMSFSSTLRD